MKFTIGETLQAIDTKISYWIVRNLDSIGDSIGDAHMVKVKNGKRLGLEKNTLCGLELPDNGRKLIPAGTAGPIFILTQDKYEHRGSLSWCPICKNKVKENLRNTYYGVV